MPSVLDSMQSCLNAIAKKELLTHQDRDVKVLVATCVCEITRITAPEAPYSDDVLKVCIWAFTKTIIEALKETKTSCVYVWNFIIFFRF